MKERYRVFAIALVVAVLLAGFGLAAPPARAATQNGLVKVTGAEWYSANSTLQGVPGTSGVPLLVSFVMLTNGSAGQVMNISANLTSPFSYTVVPGQYPVTNYTFAPIVQGAEYTIVQLVNISSAAATGYYTESLSYSITGPSGPAVQGSATFTLPLLGSVSLVAAGSSFGSPSSPIPGTPGMKYVPLTVDIENTGNSAAANITASYQPSGYLYGAQQTTYVSAVAPYGFVQLTFLVSIAGSTPEGFVEQNLTLSYNGANHAVPFYAPVTGYASLSLVNFFTNPPVIYQNEKFVTLEVFAVNSGNSYAGNVTVSAASGSFSVLTSPYALPAFPPGAQLNFTFVLNALNSTGPAPVTLTIGPGTYTLPLYIKPEGSVAISSAIPTFNPGSSSQLMTFNLENTGNTTLYDLNIHLLSASIISIHIPTSNPFAALTADNVTFAQLDPGQSLVVTFLVDTSSSAAVGTYPAQLLVTWLHNDSSNLFFRTYSFSEVVKKSSVQQFTDAFTLDPLNTAVLVVIVLAAVIAATVAVRRSRRRKREGEGAGEQEVVRMRNRKE